MQWSKQQFYILATKKFGWTKDLLINKIGLQSYEKYLLNQTNFDKTLPEDEYNFGFLDMDDSHSETELERALMRNIRSFLT